MTAFREPVDRPRYTRANLFVGKYRVPGDGHIRLPDTAVIRVLLGSIAEEGWQSDDAGEPWLIVQDGDFWPVMVRLEKPELRAYGFALAALQTRPPPE